MKLIPAKEEDAKPGNVILEAIDGTIYIAKSSKYMHKMIKEIESKYGKPPVVRFYPSDGLWFY